MNTIFKEVRDEFEFLRTHTLQPKWFKYLKSIILFAVVFVYFHYFGGKATTVFMACFVGLALTMHFLYRYKTKKYSQSWRDFIVYEENGIRKYKGIGILYYFIVLSMFIVSALIGQFVFRL